MKKWKLIGISLALLGITSVLLYLYFTGQKSTIQSKNTRFNITDTASISKIFIADMRGNSVILQRQDDNSWKVNKQYPAIQHSIDLLLETVNLMTVKAPVAKARYDKTIRDLATVGIKVEFFQGGNTPSKVLYIGTPNQSHTGSYMMLAESNLPYLVHIEGFNGFLSPRFSPHLNDWRAKHIFYYSPKDIAEITVSFPEKPDKGFTIKQHPNGTVSLLNHAGIPVNDWDTATVFNYIDRYSNISFEMWEETKSPLFIDSVRTSTPMEVYQVTNKQGQVTKVETFLKPLKNGIDIDGNPIDYDQDRMYAEINDTEFVIIQYFVFDPLNHEIGYFFIK